MITRVNFIVGYDDPYCGMPDSSEYDHRETTKAYCAVWLEELSRAFPNADIRVHASRMYTYGASDQAKVVSDAPEENGENEREQFNALDTIQAMWETILPRSGEWLIRRKQLV